MATRALLFSGAAVLALVTACSSSGGGAYGGGGGGGGGSTPAAKAPAAAGAAVTISMNGSTLTGPDGHTLYTNTVDTAAKITCVAGCAKEWPPLTGTPKAGTGVDAAALSTTTRPGGGKQVTLNGHPLYEFSADKAPGDKNGEGIADEGGSWHVATVTGAAPSAPTTSDDNGGGSSAGTGYTY